MLAIAEERGLTLVHPYDDPRVMAGQGTLGAELIEEQPDLDCAIIQIGGGGLISGCAVAMKKMKPAVEIFGVQAELYPSMKAALDGSPAICAGQTLAEGIAVKNAGLLTRPIVQALVSDIMLVSDSQVEQGVAAFMSLQKTMAEGAGAAGLAALVADAERFRGRKVGIVLSGGNIDVRMLASIMIRGLEREGQNHLAAGHRRRSAGRARRGRDLFRRSERQYSRGFTPADIDQCPRQGNIPRRNL